MSSELDLDADTTMAQVLPQGDLHTRRPRLVVLRTSSPANIGRQLRLERPETTLGRGEVDFSLEDPGISRRHAKVVLSGDGTFEVVDLGSTNGTYVNGCRVTRAVLSEGDKIQIGTLTTLKFSLRDQIDPIDETQRQALAADRIGTWDWNVATGAVTWSSYVDRLLGHASGVLSGRPAPLADFVHPDDRPAVMDKLKASLAAPDSQVQLAFRMVHGSAEPRWVELQGDLLLDQAGKPVRVTGTLVDITSHKKSEEELRRQALLFENLCDGVMMTDLQGRIIDWNPSAQRMFGPTKEMVLGKLLTSVLGQPDAQAVMDAILATLGVQERWTGEMTFVGPDGRERVSEVIIFPMRDNTGAALAHIAVHRDITERKQLQARLLLSDRMASVGTLAAGVAHEINNPLTYISANLTFVQDDLRKVEGAIPAAQLTELRSILAECQEGSNRIRDIVADLKAFSRESSGQKLEAVSLHKALEFVLRMAENEIRHRAQLVKEFGEIPPVFGNESRLGQVFLNLLINAAQAIPEGDAHNNQIRVRTDRAADGRVVVEVSDSGAGIPEPIRARIFDPFFTTKPVGVGTGLGLSVCHAIVTSFGGEISVESEQGKGSTFRVILPPAPLPNAETQIIGRADGKGGRARVLVVDDEPSLGVSLRRLLGREHDVSIAADAAEALELVLAGQRFDLVLCDLMMPEMTGMDLYSELSRRAPDQAERMVFMTGGAFTQRAASFLEDPHHRHLPKPLDLNALRKLLSTVATGTSAQGAA